LLTGDLERDAKVECLKLRAFSLYLLNRRDEARAAWLELGKLAPGYRPDPIEVSPELVKFFGAIDTTAPPRAASPPPSQPPAGPSTTAALTPAPVVAEGGCAVVVCLVPAGVGQFANGDVMKGTLLATGEVTMLGLNIGMYMSRAADYRHGPIDDAKDRKKSWVQHGALVGFLALTAFGIVDAFMHDGSP
jgi:hypothetical protein